MKRIIGLATMNRRLIAVVVACVALSACVHLPSRPSTSKPSNDGGKSSDGSSSSATKAGDGSSYAANAANVNDACTLMPADLVKKIVPNANAPTREQYPRRCNVSNGTSVLEITVETGMITPVDPIQDAEFISGLAEGGYLERLDPHSRGDTYLTVILGKDPRGVLHVEVAGHDGKDHKDDAIAVARDILIHLK